MDFNNIIDSLRSFSRDLPPIGGALLTFVVGWLVAILARLLIPKLLGLLRFDRLSEKTGIASFLRKGNVHHSPSRLIGYLVYWFLMIIVLSNTVARLDKGAANSLSAWMRSALPNLLATLITVIIGFVVVTFLSNFIVTIARNAAVHSPDMIGRIIKYLGYFVVATMALEQLGLGQTIISTIFIILFAAIALGIGLAFGLGCKDMAKKAFEDFLKNLREKQRVGQGTDLEG
ncbi:MAG: hypothetical protein RBT73_07200 [Spirochaetia bacterium]|jgi:small-conductance mechanosensitive channel|nr:hypothetical protein [Spirochaetia bacterium]